ncbi:hypothetical protein WHZ77_13395 [Bradyrhizobium sp. A5]|uniref:hypothetical protein n=1 Tax=Bradyrhizobium sp. A5 TaxID=3133696 RepID=UPI00324D591F
MRIDQHCPNAGAAEHCGGGRAGQSSADDGNVGVAHGVNLCRRRQIAASTDKKALVKVIKVHFARV